MFRIFQYLSTESKINFNTSFVSYLCLQFCNSHKNCYNLNLILLIKQKSLN